MDTSHEQPTLCLLSNRKSNFETFISLHGLPALVLQGCPGSWRLTQGSTGTAATSVSTISASSACRGSWRTPPRCATSVGRWCHLNCGGLANTGCVFLNSLVTPTSHFTAGTPVLGRIGPFCPAFPQAILPVFTAGRCFYSGCQDCRQNAATLTIQSGAVGQGEIKVEFYFDFTFQGYCEI